MIFFIMHTFRWYCICLHTIVGPYIASGCQKSVVDCTDEYCIAFAPGTWAKDGFCLITHKSTQVTSNNYILSADIKNIRSHLGINAGSVGLAYNMKDSDNFDFAYFR